MGIGAINKKKHLQQHNLQSLTTIYFFILTIYAYSNFVSEIIPPLVQVISVIKAIADAILIIAGVKYIFCKENSFLKKSLVALFVFSSVTYFMNRESTNLIAHLNGIREPLVLIVALAVLTSIFCSSHRIDFISRMNKFMLTFLIIQTPIAIYQFLRYGAGDLVGGTFSIGGSGMLSQVIFIAVYYFFIVRAIKPNHNSYDLKKISILSILLIPVFINETKISFIYLGLLIVLQLKINFNIGKIIMSGVINIVILFLFTKILNMTTDINLSDYFDADMLESYYFSDWSEAEDITRFGKLFLTINDFDEHSERHIFGAGYGLMKGKFVTGASLAGMEYERLYYGSRMMAFSAYIQGGIALIIIYLWLNFYYFGSSRNKNYKSNFIRYKLFLFSIFVLMWVYNDALLVTYFSLFAAYFLVFLKYGDLSEAASLISRPSMITNQNSFRRHSSEV